MKAVFFALIACILVSCGTKSKTTTGIVATTSPTSTTDTGTVSSGTVTLSASPSTSAAVGGTIQLTATVSGISNPVYDYYYVSGNSSSVTASQNGNIASVSSSSAATIVIGVSVTSSSDSSIEATDEISLQFGTGGSTTTTTGSITCTLSHTSSSSHVYSNFTFNLIASSGEQLRLVSWDPGECWDGAAPTFPITLPMAGTTNYFYGHYTSTGVKHIKIVAESVSRPGVFCNGGAALTDTISIY